jgi:hypothetical protein
MRWTGFFGAHKTSLKSKIPVFIDSPLGLKITKIYSKLTEYWDKEAIGLLQKGDHPIDFNHLYSVERHTEHVKTSRIPRSGHYCGRKRYVYRRTYY